MRTTRNTIGLAVIAAAAMMVGCLDAAIDTGTPIDTTGMSVSASGPESAATTETVSLSAAVDGADSADGVTYEWYQTYGRLVSLSSKTGANVSFVAPSLRSAQTLRFRVDALANGSSIGSALVEVTVNADPDAGATAVPTDSTDNSSSTGNDPFPQVKIVTIKGIIRVELDRNAAPITVDNFLRYVDDGFYSGTVFHRVIPDFVVQGGGFDTALEQKETRPAIELESNNGLKNDRGTIAMARTNSPNSATSQFYFNLVDNDALNYRDDANPGYAVFGKIIDQEGLDTIDAIAEQETSTQNGMSDVPVETMVILQIDRIVDDSGS